MCVTVCVCFYLIHLRDTGRIRALHQSLVFDSVTPCDPTFTWVLLDCGSPLSLLLSWGGAGDEYEKERWGKEGSEKERRRRIEKQRGLFY